MKRAGKITTLCRIYVILFTLYVGAEMCSEWTQTIPVDKLIQMAHSWNTTSILWLIA